MKSKIFGASLLAIACIGLSLVWASQIVLAAETSVFPIKELGNCKDEASCASFCTKTDNMLACTNYAEAKGMITPEQAAMSKKVAARVAAGNMPGGCKDEASCKAVCSADAKSIKECIAFAEELGVIPAAELAQAKKVLSALDKGAELPGGCKNQKECENYCSVGANIDSCLTFAEAANLMSSEELAQAKKVAPFLKTGETPGKCTTKQSCDTYCSEDSNFGECLGFAEKVGFLSPEDAAMARKVGGKGPGNCKNKDACEAYCKDDTHADECFNFAAEKGLIPEEQLTQMTEGVSQIKDGLNQVPPDARGAVEACLRSEIGAEKYDGVMAGTRKPTKDFAITVPKCFESAMKEYAQKMMESASKGAGAAGGAGAPNGMGVPPEIQAQMQSGTSPTAEQIEKLKESAPSTGATGGPDCSVFAAIPKCSMTGPAGEAYCKKCFPDK